MKNRILEAIVVSVLCIWCYAKAADPSEVEDLLNYNPNAADLRSAPATQPATAQPGVAINGVPGCENGLELFARFFEPGPLTNAYLKKLHSFNDAGVVPFALAAPLILPPALQIDAVITAPAIIVSCIHFWFMDAFPK